MTVFNRKDKNKYWVGLDVPLGPATIADVVLVDVSAGISHAFVFRASGCPDTVYDFDVLRGLALSTCMPAGLKCATVSFLYLQSFEVVELDVSRWFSSRCLRNVLNSKGKLPAWDGLQAVVFAFFHVTDGQATITTRFPGGAARNFASCNEVFSAVSEFAMENGSFIKLLSWGFRDVYDPVYERRVFDLEYALATRMNVKFEDAAAETIRNVRPLSEPCDGGDEMPGVEKLILLYKSCVQKGALVYFDKASVPVAVDIYSINSVAFSLSRGTQFKETHTL